MHLNNFSAFYKCDEIVTKGMMADSATFFLFDPRETSAPVPGESQVISRTGH